jgi:predicted Zn-dependent peptidase
MLLQIAALAGTIALLAAAAPGPSPSPAPGERFSAASIHDFGGVRAISETLETPAGVVQLSVSAGIARQSASEGGVASLLAECVTRTPVPLWGGQMPLRDAVAQRGGVLSWMVDGTVTRFTIDARADRLPELVGLLGKALAAPDLSAATLAAARNAQVARFKEVEDNPVLVGIEIFRRQYAPATGGATIGSPSMLAGIGAGTLRSFYAAAYRHDGASVSTVGPLSAELSAAIAQAVGGLPAGAVPPLRVQARPIPDTLKRLVTHRSIGSPLLVMGFAAPPPTERDFGAMLVIQAVLADTFDQPHGTTLRFAERTVAPFYSYDTVPASLVLSVNGARVDPTMALHEIGAVTHVLSEQKLNDSALARFKSAAVGSFVLDTLSPVDRSTLLGQLATAGLGDDPLNGVVSAIDRTTSVDVQRAAKRYLQRAIVAIVLPRGE